MKELLNFSTLIQAFEKTVWQTPLDTIPASRRRLISGLRITHLIIRDLMTGMITLRAMGLVYTTILAFVPLLAVSFSVLKGFGVHNQIEPMLLAFFQPMGDKGVELTERIIGFVDNTKAGVLGSLGLALLIYTVVSLLQKIEHAFNYTWHVAHLRPFGQRLSDYLAVLIIGPVLLFTAVGVTASISSISLIQGVLEFETIGAMARLLGYLIPYLLVIGAFTFIYVFVPNTKVNIKSALVGAIVAGGLWETASWAFAAFVVNSAKYTAIYSAFATMIIFFIWLYVNWLILLVGCSIVFYHQKPAYRRLGSRFVRFSNRSREVMAINMMVLVARHYRAHQPAWSVEALAEHMGVNAEVCKLLVDRLVKAGLLTATAGTPVTYLPAYDPYAMPLTAIMTAIRRFEEGADLSYESVGIEQEIKDLHAGIEIAIAQSLEGRTLGELAGNDVNRR